MIEFNILTIFPEMFENFTSSSICARAISSKLIDVNLYNFRDYTLDKHKRVDDYPFGDVYKRQLFEVIAVVLSITLDNFFYFINFTYIGSFIALGLFLYIKKYKYARLVVQFGVGLYMLVYLGLLNNENMQIEGFWFYLFSGVFEAATIHYAVAKIFGPLFFGRGWCGYACWTAMILDLLPYNRPETQRKKIGYIMSVSYTHLDVYKRQVL